MWVTLYKNTMLFIKIIVLKINNKFWDLQSIIDYYKKI